MSHKSTTPFQWIDFCRDHHIVPKDRGKSTAKGFVYVSCPWCIDGAENQYMGLNTSTTFFGCWKGHHGQNPARLIKALLGIAWDKANELAEIYAPQGLGFQAQPSEAAPEVAWRPYNVEQARLSTKFDEAATVYLAQRHVRVGDFYALGGRWGGTEPANLFSWRVTLPVERPDGTVVGITGRHVGRSLRYLTLPQGEMPGLVGPSWARNSSTLLLVVEGPFDAVKMQIAARYARLPIDVVALLGVAGSGARRALVSQMARRYEHTACMLDDASYNASIEMAEETWGAATAHLCGEKDPGKLTVPQAVHVLKRVWSCTMEDRAA
jgi:hypothetical protein